MWIVGAAIIGHWASSSQALGWRHGLGFVVLAAAGAAAWMGWKNSAAGQLAWDGQDWRWESRGYKAGAVDYAVAVACDFQSLMLLRMDNPAHAKMWLWIERGACPERWLDLRRAMHSPHRSLSNAAAKDPNLV